MRKPTSTMLAVAFAAAILLALRASGGYIPVEWIKASGSQWIFTGYTPAADDRVEMKASLASDAASQTFWCSRGTTTSTNTFTAFFVYANGSANNKKARFDYGGRSAGADYTSAALAKSVAYVLSADGATKACTVTRASDSAVVATATMTEATPLDPAGPFSLFASHTQGAALSASTAKSQMNNFGTYTLYSFRVYGADGSLKRNFIPARDDAAASGSLAQYGLYETVGGTFHPGLGTGAFTAGADSSPRAEIVVRGDMGAYGAPASTAFDGYGSGYLAGGTEFRATVPDAEQTTGDGLTRFSPAGWTLFVAHPDGTTETLRGTAETKTVCAYTPTEGDLVTLTWHWDLLYRVAATADEGLTAAASPEWVAPGETATLSVAEDTALFACWTGDVPAADIFRPTFALTVDAPKSVHAGTATAIRYVAPGGTGDGSSWASPLGDVRAALLSVGDLASGASLVCIKEGLYLVTNAAAVRMSAPVAVRGGYAGDGFARGGETVLARTNGAPQSAILAFTASMLELDSLTFSNGWSQTSYWGQGVALQSACTASVRDCRFVLNGNGNLADKNFYGGAIGAQNGTLCIDGCDFTRNSLHAGSGNVYPLGGAVGASGARVRISNSAFDRNYVQMVHARSYGGGAVGVLNGGLEISGCTFTTNYARTGSGNGAYSPSTQTWHGPYGGTILARGSSATPVPVAIRDCEILGGWNNAYSSASPNWVWGGTVFLYYADAEIARTAVSGAGHTGYASGNTYTYGHGSVDVCGGALALRNVLVGSSYAGWALGNQGGAITAENCTFAGTQKHGLASRSAAAYFQVSGTASFRHCILRDNAGGDFLVVAGEAPTFEYCVTDEPQEGFGNKVVDPLFGDSIYYHPASRAGRYAGGFLTGGSWTIDEETSPTIDAGDPALDWGDEPQPNLRRLNLGYDGGTASASKSDCTENPVVDETALQIFAYAANATTEAAVLSADVASLGGGTNAVVTLVWGDADHGTDLAAWGANTVTFPGSHGEWELLSHTLPNPPRGTTYYRFRAENDTGVAWSAPARTFVLSSPPALAYDTPENPVSLLRHTSARLNATLVDDCGMDTTAYALYWPDGDEASAVRVDLNFGDPVPEGPLDFDLSGLAPGTTYAYVVAAVNGMGETRLATNAFTAVAASTPLVRYVAPEPSGLGDGSSFANATSNLQWAVDFTELAGDEIRLVAGTNTLADTVDVANHPGLVIRGGYTADDERGGWSCLRRDASQSRKYRILHASASALLVDSVEFADGAYETPGTYYGQAVSLMSACTATFTNCLFRDNGTLALTASSDNDGHTSQYGGAIGANGGALAVVDCVFRNNRIWGGNYNTQPYGGAIAAYNADVSILRSAFDANCTQTTHSRVGGGGAIFLHTCRNANIAECQFTTNYCRTGGGTYAHGNTQTGPFGGTLWLYNTTANVTDCDIAGGWLSNGTQGGIYYGVGGVAFVSGASADVTFDRMRVHDCGFTGQGNATSAINKQTQNDFCVASGKLTVKNGLFTRAYGSTQFSNRGGVLDVVNCTVTGGRGLATSRSQQTFVHTSGTTTLRNLIVWGNSGDALYAADGSTAPTVVCCDLEAADPLFKNADAGDYRLKADSPCRDAGDRTGFTRDDLDLDHDRRVRGAIDLGCLESSLSGLFLFMR